MISLNEVLHLINNKQHARVPLDVLQHHLNEVRTLRDQSRAAINRLMRQYSHSEITLVEYQRNLVGLESTLAEEEAMYKALNSVYLRHELNGLLDDLAELPDFLPRRTYYPVDLMSDKDLGFEV